MDEWLTRLWGDLAGRLTGPMTFRIVLQPVMASIMAVIDGMEDARCGRPAYFWTILTDVSDRARLLKEGLVRVFRVIVLGVAMDVIYQVIVFRRVHPVELIIVVLVLAFVPYLLVRGPVNRLVRPWLTPRRATGR